jgi:hypothetical protein
MAGKKKEGRVIFTDFTDKARGKSARKERAHHVSTIYDLADEFHLPNLVAAYEKGDIADLMIAGEGHDEFVIEIFPYDFAEYQGISGPVIDKGFRLRTTLTDPDIESGNFDPEGPFHFEVLFSEVSDGLFRQNGFFRPFDSNGGMIYPKLANETIKALVRRLAEYTPKAPDFGPG